jgi:hypothetical protein
VAQGFFKSKLKIYKKTETLTRSSKFSKFRRNTHLGLKCTIDRKTIKFNRAITIVNRFDHRNLHSACHLGKYKTRRKFGSAESLNLWLAPSQQCILNVEVQYSTRRRALVRAGEEPTHFLRKKQRSTNTTVHSPVSFHSMCTLVFGLEFL